MADIPPAPIQEPLIDSDGNLTPVWVRWFKRIETIIKGLP